MIWGNKDFALVLTAKHVLQEGVTRIQRPETVTAAPNYFTTQKTTTPSADPNALRVVWGGPEHSTALNVLYGEYNDELDIALCLVTIQEGEVGIFAPASVPIETAVPDVGSVVHMVSMYGLDSTEVAPPVDRSGIGQQILIDWRVSIRVGLVTGVYPQGHRQYNWPCFTTTIPAEPGMSGGFVYVPRDGGVLGACGIVCADCSPDSARFRHDECGSSIVACSWPALALRGPVGKFSRDEYSLQSLYEMALRGDLDVLVGGIDHLQCIDGRMCNRTT
ncbi:MAG: hypothetical protein ACREHE_16185 [Rhizomicrobium sp.]